MAIRKCALEDLAVRVDKDFWAGKRVLVTGHTGFKGGWLTLWLKEMGARVTGIALPPDTTPNLFEATNLQEGISHVELDIRNATAVAEVIAQAQPQIVLHLAAQPLVRQSYTDPLDTWSTNVMGSANLLEILRKSDSVKAIIVITTDKVYQNQEWWFPYRENDALGGHDPYSASKAATEILTSSYRSSFFNQRGVALATARAGNVMGGGDWSADRLIPDAIRTWQAGEPLSLRNPEAIRPWQHVLEPISGYLTLAQKLWTSPNLSDAYNFGPEATQHINVRTIVDKARQFYGRGDYVVTPATDNLHETQILTLDTSKTRQRLGIKSVWSIDQCIQHTMTWYRAFENGQSAYQLCKSDISDFESME
ncbi:CDP-glucose 4,6-dehydratase [Halothiobacillus diazotrophicus]|uniref:CDP-glucose 4,6-dehydratase n=1 Tax=Halothiobacillus diazotrophicus TaxID=1860122 RepID=A0A191ZII7_9GAMM|nr:CDP-glucose 4,6-dehydratase [Halothiobacillus diazotrophicus]ANJ67716.1 CDP-glucose 4,6-dehydratase [Halothiobacillus diazotrophicus]